MEEPTLRVASLNCWDLYIAKDRRTRIGLIGKYLAEASFDIIGLQEVWIRADYQRLVDLMSAAYPHSYYFKSGVMGSGLAIFSRYPISQVFFHRYSLNGHIHRVYHADWFSGKGVAGARIVLPSPFNLTVDFYNTHMHAEYSQTAERYLVHRICQWQELVQFVQRSAILGKHLVVVVGDFNTTPDSLPYLMFVKHQMLFDTAIVDSWASIHGKDSTKIATAADDQENANGSSVALCMSSPAVGWTFNLPANKYFDPKKPPERLDYIFFVPKAGLCLAKASVEEGKNVKVSLPLPEISLSDHSLVTAVFELAAVGSNSGRGQQEEQKDEQREEQRGEQRDEQKDEQGLVNQVITLIDKDMAKIERTQCFFQLNSIAMSLLFGLFYAFTAIVTMFPSGSAVPSLLVGFMVAVQPFFLVIAFVSLVLARIFLQQDLSTLHAFRSEWQLWLLAHADPTS